MNSEISVLIVEDEALWAKHLELSLAGYGFTVAATVAKLEDALLALESVSFDIALVDINLAQRNSGIQLGKIISTRYHKPFIFVTASVVDNELLSQALDARPSAYLQKPSTPTQLFAAIQLALQNFSSHSSPESLQKMQPELPDSFYIKTGNSYKKINWKEVVYLATDGNYTKVFTEAGGTFLLRSSLQKTLKLFLPPAFKDHFLQINRGEAIQDSYIQEIKGNAIYTRLRTFTIKDSFEKDLKQKLRFFS